MSLVSPISGAYPLVTTVLALAVSNAQLSTQQVIGIALVLVGVLLAAELIKFNQPIGKIGAGPAWALLTVAGWGSGFTLLAQAISRIGWETTTLIEFIAVAITFTALLLC